MRQCALRLECRNEGQNPVTDLCTLRNVAHSLVCTLHPQQQTSDFQSNCMERWMLHVSCNKKNYFKTLLIIYYFTNVRMRELSCLTAVELKITYGELYTFTVLQLMYDN
jgi:hypothetical protein